MSVILITVNVIPHRSLLSVRPSVQPFVSASISLSLSFPLLSDGVNNSCVSFKEALCSPHGVFFKTTWRSSQARARAHARQRGQQQACSQSPDFHGTQQRRHEAASAVTPSSRKKERKKKKKTLHSSSNCIACFSSTQNTLANSRGCVHVRVHVFNSLTGRDVVQCEWLGGEVEKSQSRAFLLLNDMSCVLTHFYFHHIFIPV